MILKTRTDTAHMVRMKTPSQKMTQITLMPDSPMTEATRLGPRGTRLDHLEDRLRDETAGIPRENDSNMGCAPLAEAWATRLTSVGDVANSANKPTKSANVNSSAATKNWLPSSRITLVNPESQKNSKISTRRSAEPVVEANFVFAFVGKAGWPEGSVGTDEGMCDSYGNERESEESEEDDSAMVSAAATRRYDGVTPRPRVVKLLRGERLGWWSSQKFDRRVRMPALVMSAVNGRRVKILLDTGANVSAIDIQGIGKDKVSTTHKALVNVTLGWDVVYEFEIMPHHAGVDLILGTDLMIPAGIRLDLYNSAAKLPDEVVVPLLRSLKDTDDQTHGLQTADGPAEAICLSDCATAEFRLRRKQPSELTHEFWVRRTGDWIPTIVMNAKGKATKVCLTSTQPTSHTSQ
ncbi:LOW QUALITY PROTEIN: Eukaryotic/viral aspartic protease [Phytophthora palmivora]|uniref:Eukaryotic/viral aspartic protease n=1 Tax=Phytophthora palmivora TaxID=4796 RepID=A0A2P4Y6K8_9STRA|nr:LOW QUALITY PROTEIN: Eukaryotic/viral aspartic protease [Phytophthora palmivora]